ncbi:MAG: Flp pilus assembly protein CpaB [Chloroflexota bacterium]|nr:Flp pilus assembly protein CpaB [Chloroflexota bacterium]
MARSITQANPERTNRLIFIGAIGLAIMAAVLVFAALRDSGGSTKTADPAAARAVVTAAKDIKAGTRLTADMLELNYVQNDAVLAGVYSETKGLVGLTTRYPVQKGEQVSNTKIGQTVTEPGVSGLVPAAKRAVSLPLTETTGVGGLLVAGDRVDITAIIDKRTANGVEQASTLLQNVQVLSVGQTAQQLTTQVDANGTPISDSSSGARPKDTAAQPAARSITVAVDPQDVGLLALAQEQGKIYFSLRPVGEDAAVPGLDAPRTLPNP